MLTFKCFLKESMNKSFESDDMFNIDTKKLKQLETFLQQKE